MPKKEICATLACMVPTLNLDEKAKPIYSKETVVPQDL